MEAFGQFHEVRVGEVDVLVMAILHVLFPFDQAIAAVVEDEGDEICAQAVSRFKFLNVHQETGVAGDSQDFLIGMDEFGRNGTGDGNAHGGETVGDEAGVRFVAVVMTGNPDFIGADVGNDDIVLAHDAAAVDEGFLRFDREGHVVSVAFVFVDHFLTEIEELFRFSQAGGFGHDAFQRVGDVADDFDFRLVVLVDIGRHGVDVDDVGIGQMPFGRGIFDDVIADGDDQAGFFQHLGLIVVHGDADGPHGIFIVKGDGAFGHHGIDDGELQFFCESRELLGRFAADDAAAGQDDRILGIGNHGSSCFDLRFQGRFRQDRLML